MRGQQPGTRQTSCLEAEQGSRPPEELQELKRQGQARLGGVAHQPVERAQTNPK